MVHLGLITKIISFNNKKNQCLKEKQFKMQLLPKTNKIFKKQKPKDQTLFVFRFKFRLQIVTLHLQICNIFCEFVTFFANLCHFLQVCDIFCKSVTFYPRISSYYMDKITGFKIPGLWVLNYPRIKKSRHWNFQNILGVKYWINPGILASLAKDSYREAPPCPSPYPLAYCVFGFWVFTIKLHC